jgi:hypothetical protein
MVEKLCSLLHAIFLVGIFIETESSETSVNFQRTAPRYIPEDRTLHNHSCDNLKSYNINFNVTNIKLKQLLNIAVDCYRITGWEFSYKLHN